MLNIFNQTIAIKWRVDLFDILKIIRGIMPAFMKIKFTDASAKLICGLS